MLIMVFLNNRRFTHFLIVNIMWVMLTLHTFWNLRILNFLFIEFFINLTTAQFKFSQLRKYFVCHIIKCPRAVVTSF